MFSYSVFVTIILVHSLILCILVVREGVFILASICCISNVAKYHTVTNTNLRM